MNPLIAMMQDLMREMHVAPRSVPVKPLRHERRLPNVFEHTFRNFVLHQGWRAHRFGEVEEYQSPGGGPHRPLAEAFLIAHRDLIG